jgi:hypothetical protein
MFRLMSPRYQSLRALSSVRRFEIGDLVLPLKDVRPVTTQVRTAQEHAPAGNVYLILRCGNVAAVDLANPTAVTGVTLMYSCYGWVLSRR